MSLSLRNRSPQGWLEEKPGNEVDKGLYGKALNHDWVASVVILEQIFLIVGRCCNQNFCNIPFKIQK